MRHQSLLTIFLPVVILAVFSHASAAGQSESSPDFHTSEKCVNCHGKVITSESETMSIAADWGASIMANSARDPYWQGSVRREVLDHRQAGAAIQTECATCHMPLQSLSNKSLNHGTDIFTHLPFHPSTVDLAADGVSCTVCHQIQPNGLGTPATFNGLFAVAPSGTQPRPVFGPFNITNPEAVQVHQMATGYAPVQSPTIREAALCGSCHTLYTQTLGPGGKPVGYFPDQMYPSEQHTCFAVPVCDALKI
jgi:hypothetical protein